ncbi:MAG: hypothetical protein Q7W02_06670 [Candidatus Rokubacteria bacterium]|nr:hypothetical protein [Candidatus Rokubacteria bacterium]
MHEGLVAYGVSLPYHRLPVDRVNEVWLNTNFGGVKSLQISERGVVGPDEDVITYAAEAGRRALAMTGVPREKTGACYLGTHTGPYVSRARLVEYGLAIGADALAFTATPTVSVPRRLATVDALLARKRVVDYATSMKFERKYDQPALRMSAFE